MSRVQAGARGRRRRWRRTLALILAPVLLGFSVVTARLFIWPPLRPLPSHVDAIIELAGPGNRDRIALALARAHRARYVVQSTMASDAVSDTCLPPVPGVTVLCFHPDPSTTRGEAESIRRLTATYGWHSIVLVTSPDQAWRAHLRVVRCFGGPVYVATTPLPLVDWPGQIAYQWAATVKALAIQREC
jgi:hypothetical protein